MKTNIFILFFCIILFANSFPAFSQSAYYSVQDGNFSDNIWNTGSGDTSPCSKSCFPFGCSSDTIGLIGNKTIYIRDSVYTKCEMRIRGTFNVVIESGGMLVIDGGNNIRGDGNLIINSGGSALVTGDMDLSGNSLVTVDGELAVEGTILFAGNACIIGSGIVEAAAVSGSNNCPGANPILPIELLFFNAHATGKTVLLTWATSSEKNNNYFTIERSENGIDFYELLVIAGVGNSNENIHYQATDATPFSGRIYYKLKQTDVDGRFSYLKMATVTINPTAAFTISPNPLVLQETPNLNITGLDKEKEILLVIFDMNGNSVFSTGIESNPNGESLIAIDPYHLLKSGVYILVATSGQKIYRQKLVIL